MSAPPFVPPRLAELLPVAQLELMVKEGYVSVSPHPLDSALVVLCYTSATQVRGVWNSVTRLTRGLIVRKGERGFEDAVVLKRPWQKFFTLDAHDSNWSLSDEEREEGVEVDVQSYLNAPAVVMDKLDGSMGVLYRSPDGLPALSTKGSFSSEQAVAYTARLRSTPELLREAELLLRERAQFTQLFELVGPENAVVLDYAQEDIVLLGEVHTLTGEALSPLHLRARWAGTGFTVAELLPAGTLREALELPERSGREGLVVLMTPPELPQLMVKIKQGEYLRAHSILNSASTRSWRAALREATPTYGKLLAYAREGDRTVLEPLLETLRLAIPGRAARAAEAMGLAFVEARLRPLAERVAEAVTLVEGLPPEALTGPHALRDFALSQRGESNGNLRLAVFRLFREGEGLDRPLSSATMRSVARE